MTLSRAAERALGSGPEGRFRRGPSGARLAFPLRVSYIAPHSTGGFFAAPAQGPAPVARLASPSNDPPRLNRTRTTPMALPDFPMRGLLEAGAHFGHQSHRWNPKMEPFIFGSRHNIHIIDLAQTVPLLHQALKAVSDTVARGGRILFVGTKRQAQEAIAAAAKRSAQYYINSRWLGGMLTNWKTISGSIQRLRRVQELLETGAQGLTKKERLMLSREREKLEKALGGIKDMGGTPDLIFVIDTNREQWAIREAKR